ncbi:uncharacterized protein LOC135588450 [Musa acuminata AAA Group]|uniref:uncharacterized protein LOC135588450 n=1 Tax=Musa acuminata AAA Group TaxID=214697 RepID=UPI0031D0CF58
MSKLWTSCNAGLLLAILLDDFLSFCTFLTSHPLHLAYLLFFFPYLAQLLSFLSPLLLSTVVLLLVLLTISPYLDEAPPAAPPEFVGKTCCIVLSILKDNLHGNGRIDLLDQFASIILSSIDDASPSSQESAAQALFGEFFEDACSDPEPEEKCLASAVGGGGSSLEETPTDVALGISATDGEHQVANSGTGIQCRATEAQAKGMPNAREVLGSHREFAEPKRDEDRAEHLTESMTIERLQSYGSIRKEKEWKRTLACKLYEERMTYKLCKERKVAEGGEEMDLLWEAYEANASETDTKKKEKKARRVELEEEEEEEEEDEEEEATTGQLCCLQALKLSAGKMNLGMGKRNLMKISKVLKGMRMFHVGSRKSTKA